MKKRWGIIIGAVLAVLVLVVGGLSLSRGYFILAPHVEMELNGKKSVTIDAFSDYEDPGAAARRGREDLTDQIKTEGKVNLKKPGKYTITYRLEQEEKEYAVERTVTVVDHEAPKLQLEGDEEMLVSARSLYEEPGFTAIDRCDGDLADQVEVSEQLEGETLTLTYQVHDAAGNEVTAQRVVTIRDEVAPEIHLTDGNIYVLQGSTFQDPGFTAVDDADGDISASVSCTGQVDTSKRGVYSLNYSVSDSAGNQATAERIVHVYKEDVSAAHRVYLTFDDGPSGNVTPRILDILKANNVKATFFINNYGEGGKYLIRRMIDEGHTVGLHGYSHDYAAIYSSDQAALENMYSLHDKILRDFGYDARIIRFPGGSSNTVSAAYNIGIMSRVAPQLERDGFVYFDWNVDSQDATGTLSADTLYANVTGDLFWGGDNVVLMHDSGAKETTADALQGIITFARSNGYALLPITEDTPPVHHGIAN